MYKLTEFQTSKNSMSMQKELQVKTNYAAVGEEISPAMAVSFVKSFVEAYPTEVQPLHIGRNIIEHILAQPGCCGIRFYNALNELGQRTLVYVGIDENGKDLLKKTIVGKDGTLRVANAPLGDRAGSSSSSSALDETIEALRAWIGF